MSNGNLTKAKQLKNDEFYIQLTDIEKNSSITKTSLMERLCIVIAMMREKVISSAISL